MSPTDARGSDQPSMPYRILDANANRSLEGLRVVEDLCRFGLNDRHFTDACKSLRHRLSAALDSIDLTSRLHARDAGYDVGRELEGPREYSRPATLDMLRANGERIKQSYRCLEEAAKMIDVALARQFEQQRYSYYELEQRLLQAATTQLSFADRRLYVLVDGADSREQFQFRVEQVVGGGADVIQLRDARLDDRSLLERAKLLVELGRRHDVMIIINNRPDIARCAGADGVHIGQDDLAIGDCRQILSAKMLVGQSTHSIEQARRAVDSGADYIGVGPVFASRTKKFDCTVGLELVRQVTEELSIPAFCIGGIDLSNLTRVIEAGGQRVAVSHAVNGSDNLQEATRRLIQLLDSTLAIRRRPVCR